MRKSILSNLLTRDKFLSKLYDCINLIQRIPLRVRIKKVFIFLKNIILFIHNDFKSLTYIKS